MSQRVGLWADRERAYTDLLHHDEVIVKCAVTPCRLMYRVCVIGYNIGRDVDCSLRGSLQTILLLITSQHSTTTMSAAE